MLAADRSALEYLRLAVVPVLPPNSSARKTNNRSTRKTINIGGSGFAPIQPDTNGFETRVHVRKHRNERAQHHRV